MIDIQPAPDKLIPNWANLLGLSTTVQERYCVLLKSKDQIPRGMDRKLKKLRRKCYRIIKHD